MEFVGENVERGRVERVYAWEWNELYTDYSL
jgi:hypothetical protein